MIVKEISQFKICSDSEKTVVGLYRQCKSLIKSTRKKLIRDESVNVSFIYIEREKLD